jgi:pimeloyl-ACP methyl ester carboxylesterase
MHRQYRNSLESTFWPASQRIGRCSQEAREGWLPAVPRTLHRHVEIDGVRIFYRGSAPAVARADAPVMLLLHGFPSASHQLRRLIDVLGGHYRLIAPDYPGFGYSDVPESATTGGAFTYSFDRLAAIMEGFFVRLGLTRVVMSLFAFGAPVGLRLATRHPEWVAGLVIQNGNAYDEGLSASARDFIGRRPDTPGAEDTIRGLLTLSATRNQHESGASDVELNAPDGRTLDQHFLDMPSRTQPQLDLAFDYRTNVALYPQWQAWLRERTPPVLITWGRNDPFFTEPGARAYLRDVPDAELHIFDTGHFALEEKLPEIAPLIANVLDRAGGDRSRQSGSGLPDIY